VGGWCVCCAVPPCRRPAFSATRLPPFSPVFTCLPTPIEWFDALSQLPYTFLLKKQESKNYSCFCRCGGNSFLSLYQYMYVYVHVCVCGWLGFHFLSPSGPRIVIPSRPPSLPLSHPYTHTSSNLEIVATVLFTVPIRLCAHFPSPFACTPISPRRPSVCSLVVCMRVGSVDVYPSPYLSLLSWTGAFLCPFATAERESADFCLWALTDCHLVFLRCPAFPSLLVVWRMRFCSFRPALC